MTVDALLCDSATVREGLLHVLGGGITRVWRESYPAPLGLTVAMMITLKATEAMDRHKLRIVLMDQDGNTGAQLDGEFGVSPGPDAQVGEQLAVPLLFNLGGLHVPRAGTYSIEILVDSQHARSLPFVAGAQPPHA